MLVFIAPSLQKSSLLQVVPWISGFEALCWQFSAILNGNSQWQFSMTSAMMEVLRFARFVMKQLGQFTHFLFRLSWNSVLFACAMVGGLAMIYPDRTASLIYLLRNVDRLDSFKVTATRTEVPLKRSPLSNTVNVRATFYHGKRSAVCDALLDTGADVSVINESLAKKLKIDPDALNQTTRIRGISGDVVFSAIANVDVEVAKQRIRNADVVLKPASDPPTGQRSAAPPEPACILGQDFLKHFKITLDRETLILEPQKVLEPQDLIDSVQKPQ